MNISHKAIILAAGVGSRLRPYTDDRPKCLVEVAGVSLLDRQLSVLRSEEIESIVLIGGYRIEKIIGRHLKVRKNPRYAETNMLWTLFCAEDELEGGALVCYGDIVYSREILQALLKSKADFSIVVDMDWESYWRMRNEDPLADAETLKLASDGKILEIGQKPKSLAEIEGQYIGLMKFSAKGIKTLKQVFYAAKSCGVIRGKSLEKAYMTDMLQHLIDLGVRLDSVKVHGGWVEVDTVDDLNSVATKNRLELISKEYPHINGSFG